MEFGEYILDQRPITAQPDKPLFKTIMDRSIEVADVTLDGGVHHDRYIIELVWASEITCRLDGLGGFGRWVEQIRKAGRGGITGGNHRKQIFGPRYQARLGTGGSLFTDGKLSFNRNQIGINLVCRVNSLCFGWTGGGSGFSQFDSGRRFGQRGCGQGAKPDTQHNRTDERYSQWRESGGRSSQRGELAVLIHHVWS